MALARPQPQMAGALCMQNPLATQPLEQLLRQVVAAIAGNPNEQGDGGITFNLPQHREQQRSSLALLSRPNQRGTSSNGTRLLERCGEALAASFFQPRDNGAAPPLQSDVIGAAPPTVSDVIGAASQTVSDVTGAAGANQSDEKGGESLSHESGKAKKTIGAVQRQSVNQTAALVQAAVKESSDKMEKKSPPAMKAMKTMKAMKAVKAMKACPKKVVKAPPKAAKAATWKVYCENSRSQFKAWNGGTGGGSYKMFKFDAKKKGDKDAKYELAVAFGKKG